MQRGFSLLEVLISLALVAVTAHLTLVLVGAHERQARTLAADVERAASESVARLEIDRLLGAAGACPEDLPPAVRRVAGDGSGERVGAQRALPGADLMRVVGLADGSVWGVAPGALEVSGREGWLEIVVDSDDPTRTRELSSLVKRAGRRRGPATDLLIVGDRGCSVARTRGAEWLGDTREAARIELEWVGERFAHELGPAGDEWGLGRLVLVGVLEEKVLFVRDPGAGGVPVLARADIEPGAELRRASAGVGGDLAPGVWRLTAVSSAEGSEWSIGLLLGSLRRDRAWRASPPPGLDATATAFAENRRWREEWRRTACCAR